MHSSSSSSFRRRPSRGRFLRPSPLWPTRATSLSPTKAHRNPSSRQSNNKRQMLQHRKARGKWPRLMNVWVSRRRTSLSPLPLLRTTKRQMSPNVRVTSSSPRWWRTRRVIERPRRRPRILALTAIIRRRSLRWAHLASNRTSRTCLCSSPGRTGWRRSSRTRWSNRQN